MTLVLVSVFLLFCLFSVCSQSWWTAWMFMEFSLIWFFPLVNKEFMKSKKSSVWIMFSLMSLSSIGLLLSMFMGSLFIEQGGWFNSWLILSFMFLSIKMGLPPFHSWYLEVSGCLDSWGFLLIMTVFKIPSLIFLMNIIFLMNKFNYFILTYLYSLLFFSLAGLSCFSIRHMLIYSSFINMTWSLSSLFTFSSLYVMFYIVYFLSFFLFWVIYEWSSFKQINVEESLTLSKKEMIILMLSMANMVGMPPFSIFFMKVKIILSMIEEGIMELMALLSVSLLMSVLMLWMYMSMLYLMTLWKTSLFFLNKKINISIMFSITQSVVLLISILSLSLILI
uniref:NADH-ubiquinone oxidoreductase chain 2 n=1 Tax=Pediculus schaeffi TaxID=240286 RepID=M4VP69_PEDSC|nr:NADH dehydrogenase subunit 2 [Pediculus schaeffi]